MPLNTILMDFTLKEFLFQTIENQIKLTTLLKNSLEKYIPDLKILHLNHCIIKGFFMVLTGAKESHCTIRGFVKGIVSVNIEYFKEDDEDPLISFENSQNLGTELKSSLECERYKIFPCLRRGYPFDIYLTTSDERIIEYDIDELLFEKTSPYQKVQIVHSKTLGNILLLDDIQNLSECDLIYTETLMHKSQENYEGKEIIILGGGDGALLNQLLKENPKFIFVLELDEVVIHACRKYLRSCCGTVLDNMKGNNYEIILGDCVQSLKQFIKTQRKVDYVFGDLTDIPVLPGTSSDIWDFFQSVMHSSLSILKKNGKYMTHVNGVLCHQSVKMFEDLLDTLPFAITYTKSKAFIPSFMEHWLFYQIILKD